MRPVGILSRYTFSRRSTFKRLYFALLDRPALRRVDAMHFTTEAERTDANWLSLDLEGCAPCGAAPVARRCDALRPGG
jgi:hypothetical protein